MGENFLVWRNDTTCTMHVFGGCDVEADDPRIGMIRDRRKYAISSSLALRYTQYRTVQCFSFLILSLQTQVVRAFHS